MPPSESQRKEREQTNRLHSMLVHEVSIVDRPANQRRFLVVKRSGDMDPSAELVDDGRGGLVAAGKAEDENGEKDPKEKEEEGAEAEGAPLLTGDPKPEDEEEKDEEADDATKAIAEAAAKLSSIVDSMKAAGVSIDDATQAKLDAATKAIAGFAPASPTDKVEPMPGGSDAIDTLKSVGADDATLDAINALLSKNGNGSIQKSGARMAKGRLDRFNKAMDLLKNLIGEFSPGSVAKSNSTSEASSLVSMLDPSFVAGFKRNVNASPELIEKLNKLTALVENQNSRIDKISKNSGGSNVMPLETMQTNQTVEASWPLDMNRPITRETVDKSVSFFDVK